MQSKITNTCKLNDPLKIIMIVEHIIYSSIAVRDMQRSVLKCSKLNNKNRFCKKLTNFYCPQLFHILIVLTPALFQFQVFICFCHWLLEIFIDQN